MYTPAVGQRSHVSTDITAVHASNDYGLRFGPFSLFANQGVLLEGERPVRLGSRALAILTVLVESAGELVSKNELLDKVWPNINVEPANLTVHICALRRTLSDGRAGNRYLVNVPGRGYRFVAPVTVVNSATGGHLQASPPHNLPSCLTPLIGRGDAMRRFADELSRHRLINIVGPAGVGKTSVALDVAEKSLQQYTDGVWLIDLSKIAEPSLVPTALASALGLQVRSDDPIPDLLVGLKGKQMLLVLDNCEHVIDAAAKLASEILRGTRELKILATSRETLHVEGEHVFRLTPLDSPPQSIEIRAADALAFPAVQLFVERAAAATNHFELADEDAAAASDICRKLDGIPLAIEFAAARIGAFGIRDLAGHLDDRLQILKVSRRTSSPRHQTIGTALDWSYQILGEDEQLLFRRLAIFRGGFTLDAACEVATSPDLMTFDVANGLESLVAKSLIAADIGSGNVRFRLLETTRVYALTKLQEGGELNTLAQRHAIYYRDLLEAPEAPNDKHTFAGTYAPEIDNIRTALKWAFSPKGDKSIGVSLTVASPPLWMAMSLLAECRTWVENALLHLDERSRGTRPEMLLQKALASSLLFTKGWQSETHATWERTLELAETLGDFEYQLSAILALWGFHIRFPNYPRARVFAVQATNVAKGSDDPGSRAMAEWMSGVTQHHMGQFETARTNLQHALSTDTDASRLVWTARIAYDRRIDGLSVLGNALWIGGFPTQALQTSAVAIAEARPLNYGLPLCVALGWTGITTWLAGVDVVSCERAAVELIELSKQHGFVSYHGLGQCLLAACRMRQGALAEARFLFAEGLQKLDIAAYKVFHPIFLGAFALATAATGAAGEALGMVEEFERKESHTNFWCLPEFLRQKGEVLMVQGVPDPVAAESYFLRSLDIARAGGGLGWELRTAVSLGRLYRQNGRHPEANALVKSVYGRFTEGFDTGDLRDAKVLLDELT
jgi:predicted ATPase/DNA-binding winged helix-turn-helix (wHTH) protein